MAHPTQDAETGTQEDPWDPNPVLYSLHRALIDLAIVFVGATIAFVPLAMTGVSEQMIAWADAYPRLNLTELFLYAIMLTTGFSIAILRRWMQLTDLVQRRKEAEAEVRAQAQKLKRSNEELERFAYVASHDLREPLRTVHSHLSLVERDAGDRLSESGRESLEFAQQGAERMDRMVKSLLTYAKLERDNVASRPVEAQKALDEAIANLESIAKRANVKIDASRVPRVEADMGELVLLFQNLVHNAIKHSRRPGARVRVGATRHGGKVRFFVEDEGPGVPKDQRDRVFELFRQGSADARQRGAGIGLTICKRIVERHDGAIWIEDARHGGGARVVVELDAA